MKRIVIRTKDTHGELASGRDVKVYIKMVSSTDPDRVARLFREALESGRAVPDDVA